MQFTVKTVQYNIAEEPVTIVTAHDFGLKNFSTTQTALAARCVAPNTIWSDAETVAEVQAQLNAEYPGAGHTAAAAST